MPFPKTHNHDSEASAPHQSHEDQSRQELLLLLTGSRNRSVSSGIKLKLSTLPFSPHALERSRVSVNSSTFCSQSNKSSLVPTIRVEHTFFLWKELLRGCLDILLGSTRVQLHKYAQEEVIGSPAPSGAGLP